LNRTALNRTALNRTALNRTGPQTVPVLMYHSVNDRPTRGTRALTVPVAAFARQLEILDELGLTAVTMRRLVRHWRALARGEESVLPSRPVVLTFDDGYRDFHGAVLPMLVGYRMPATLYVTTGWLADAGPMAAGRPLGPMLSRRQLAECAAEGVEIGGHSHSHPQLDRLPAGRLRDEVVRNRDLLAEWAGEAPSTFGYPFGYSDGRVREVVREAGYQGACAVANALAAPERQSPYALARLTVGPATSEAAFRAVASGERIARTYARARTLTKGYAVYRRGARALSRAPGSGAPPGSDVFPDSSDHRR
jgi:peptidoglycan/xylan/chitin deacetylase (PgdA/CDA1 family)